MTRLLTFMLIVSLWISIAKAETPDIIPPEIHTNASFDERILYRAISDNGLWAVAERRPDYDGGKIISLTDFSYTTITCEDAAGRVGRPLDVTDDGMIAVGAYGNPDRPEPAVWRRDTGKWTVLPYPDGRFDGGYVHSVTPDGHWAVGRVLGKQFKWTEMPALWDLTTGEFVQLPNLPAPRLDYYNQDANRFTAISPDGRYIIAQLSPGGSVVYDRDQEKYYAPQGTLADGRSAKVSVSDMSPAGKYYHGRAQISGAPAISDDDEDDWSNECIYDTATGEVTLIRQSGLADHMTWGVADDGSLFAGSGGNGTPMRDFQIYSNGYWYALDQILYQAYGIDYYTLTKLDNTGTPYALSSDGRIFASFTDPNRGEGWVMKFNEDLADACSRVDLMANYEVAPKAGAAISSLSTVKIGFDRNIQLIGRPDQITLSDKDGNILGNALSGSVELNKFTFTFRRRKQGEGEKYLISIPAGMLAMDGISSLKSRTINIEYAGREDAEVPLGDDAQLEYTMRCLDYSSNYITLPFQSDIVLTEDAAARLIINDTEETVSQISLAVVGNRLLAYPQATVPLFLHSDYTLLIEAGSFTDPGCGSNTLNSEIKITLHGAWEDLPEDDNTLFKEDFDSGLGNKFMFYEGDGLAPAPSMKAWGFEADTTPWWVARDDIYSTDYAAVSHAWYAAGGQSDDWMVMRRIRIPDETCRLKFDSQSYLSDMDDRLNVYVIPSDKIYNAITPTAMEEFRASRILIYDELQNPGAATETLEGDWKHNDVSLADYAGQYVYIAFVNENKDASAIFVDNVTVERNLTFSLAGVGSSTCVGLDEKEISVKIYLNSDALQFTDATATLIDSNDNPVCTEQLPAGTIWNKETPWNLTFSRQLPLTVGVVNPYRIELKAGEITTSFDRSIANLAFATEKHAVLEEFSGSTCGNCPDGIVVMEKMAYDFGNRFIPLTIRAYMGDELTPENSDYARRLGLEALGAPSAAVNRHWAGYPTERGEGGNLSYRVGNVEEGLWYDFVAAELAEMSYASISGAAEFSSDMQNVNVSVDVKFALSKENTDYSVLAVLLEDDVKTFQSNYRYNSTDPLLGPWGAGGIYGSSYVYPYYCNDVVRNVSNPNLTGQSGLIPASIVASERYSQSLSVSIPRSGVNTDKCKVALLLIDNTTGYIDNAALLSIAPAGVDTPEADKDMPKIVVSSESISITCSAPAQAMIADLSGRILARGEGEQITLPCMKGAGPVILRIVTPTGCHSFFYVF